MVKHEGFTRRDILKFSGAAAVCAGGAAWFYSLPEGQASFEDREIRLLRYRREIKMIAEACHKRWTINERYKPMLAEVTQWVSSIVFYDDVLGDTLHYCAMIDQESLGNPTHYLPSDGHTRGLGSMLITTAKEVVDEYDMHVKAIGTALFNPFFAIFTMIKHFEDLWAEGPKEGRKRWALYAYNAGRGIARRRMRRGEVIPGDYHEEHQYRKRLIRGEMKGAVS